MTEPTPNYQPNLTPEAKARRTAGAILKVADLLEELGFRFCDECGESPLDFWFHRNGCPKEDHGNTQN